MSEIARLPESSIGPRLLDDRAAEVTQRLPASEASDSLGRLGDYEIKRLLGAGSTGVVYEAFDRRLHRRVALKVLRPSLGSAAKDRFMAEARSAAAIDHPAVVTIYQVGEDSSLAYMAMELSDGQTLDQRRQEVSFLPEPEIKRITKQIAQGLAAAHRHGLIHRDIKPANIWLKANTGQALILDFGLARIADDDPQMTATGMLAGTPNYMSPEQTRGLELDGRSDLFSLGCLMYRSATGKLPFGSTGVLATLQAIQHDDARSPRQLNPHVGEDFSDLTMMLLQKQPTDRPEHANALVEALETERHLWPFRADRIAEIAPVKTKPADAPIEERRTTSRFTGWVAAVLAAGLLGWGCFAFAPQIIRIVTNHGELVIDAKDEAVKIEVLKGGEVVRVIDTKTENSIDIEAGEYQLRLKGNSPNVVLAENQLSLKRGEREIVSVTQSPNLTANQYFSPAVAHRDSVPPPQRDLVQAFPSIGSSLRSPTPSNFGANSTNNPSRNGFGDSDGSPPRDLASRLATPVQPATASDMGKDIRFDVKVDKKAINLLRQGRKVYSPVKVREQSTNAVLDPSVVSDIALFLKANTGKNLQGVQLNPQAMRPGSKTLRFEIPEQQLDRLDKAAFLFKVPDELRGRFDRVEFVVGNSQVSREFSNRVDSLRVSSNGIGDTNPNKRFVAKPQNNSPRNRFGDFGGPPVPTGPTNRFMPLAPIAKASPPLADPTPGSPAFTGPFIDPRELQFRNSAHQRQPSNNGVHFRDSSPEVLRNQLTKSAGLQARIQERLAEVALALLIHDGAHQELPAIASQDSEKKLLLSWRVHVLPFLKQGDLYKRFHLDEPWNSPHNLELLPLMPTAYADPNAIQQAINWKTQIQRPVAKGGGFDPKKHEPNRLENLEPKHIIDGAVETVLVIRVADSAAVPWTQPADWDGDAKELINNSEVGPRKFWFARADASVGSGGYIADWEKRSRRQTARANAGGRVQSPEVEMRSDFGSATSAKGKITVPAPDEAVEAKPLSGHLSHDAVGPESENDVPVYAGKTFESWMKTVRNDRQLKTKFDGLAAAAELARDNSDRQHQVMSEIVGLLRIHGSGYLRGVKPAMPSRARTSSDNLNASSPLIISRHQELRPLFIEILRRFPNEQLIELLNIEILGGTDQSRQFVTGWLLYPSAVREGDWAATRKYAELLAANALPIGQATLAAVAAPECDEASRRALLGVLPELTTALQVDWEKADVEMALGDVDPKWRDFIEQTFASDIPLKRGFAALTMVKLDPDRPGLAKDLGGLFADETVLPLIRCQGLYALEKLSPAQVRSVASSLLEVGRQQGEPKELLDQAMLASNPKRFVKGPKLRPAYLQGHTQRLSGNRISSGTRFYGGQFCKAGGDYRLAYLLGEAAPGTPELLEWLESLKTKLPKPSIESVGDASVKLVESRRLKSSIIFNAIATVTKNASDSTEAETRVAPTAKSAGEDGE